ncbi:MAG: formimidoylglutamate deiminase [Microbacteriaceae bacterium]|nr:formimidoylglutamate deiminase [Microbacteriaceae bacterium]
MNAFWCGAVVGETVERGVRFEVSDAGVILARMVEPPRPGDVSLGTVLPGAGNAHSHAFHRALRGRTEGANDFWGWRERMYGVANALEPDTYFALARAVFAEMLVAGYTAVGEFHYVHHGAAFPHEFELALVAAAEDVGIRLTLLDTAYLAGGFGLPLAPEQRRFGDGDADGYLERWYSLRERVPSLGAAIHSVRAVPPDDIARIVAGLPADVPLHVHVSEQPRENADCRAAYGVTPARLLGDLGALTARTSVVHATHLTGDDVRLLADATVVMCPTTEADLGDGIGPARALADAGARIAIGSDQNCVVDPLLELRGLEAHERLGSGLRGRFAPSELVRVASADGYGSLGLGAHALAVGDRFDAIELSTTSVRTTGADAAQLVLTATASDVERVFVGGAFVARGGVLADGRDPADLLAAALGALR